MIALAFLIAGCATAPRTFEGHETDDAGAHTFMLRAPDAHSVHIVGSFNEWDPEEFALHQVPGAPGFWRIRMLLPPGEHQFGYLVLNVGDTEADWVKPPHALRYVPDGFGSKNGVVEGGAGVRASMLAGVNGAVQDVEVRAAEASPPTDGWGLHEEDRARAVRLGEEPEDDPNTDEGISGSHRGAR